MKTFTSAISDTDNPMYPLRFLREDIKNGVSSFTFSKKSFEEQIITALVQFMMTGEAKLLVEDADASDVIKYGLGFPQVRKNTIHIVKITELAVIECLRYFVPLSDLALKICDQIAPSSAPQMVGILLEYLVAY
jgi:hypothetical protein